MQIKKVLLLAVLLFYALPSEAHHTPTFGFGGTAGPIITNPASTLLKGHWAVGYRLEALPLRKISRRKLGREAERGNFPHSTGFFISNSLGISYGLFDDFTISLRIPVTSEGGIEDAIINRRGVGSSDDLGTAAGIGDITLFGQYRFYKSKPKQLEAALIAGVDIPSGVKRIKDNNGDLFGDDHQPGKGAWDPLVGLSLTKRFGNKLSIDTNYLYTIAVKGNNDYDAGDLHNYNAAITYRLLDFHDHVHGEKHSRGDSHKHSHTSSNFHAHSPSFSHSHKHSHEKWFSKLAVDGVLELNGEWRQKQKFDGIVDNNSGGSNLFVSPGVRFVYGNWASAFSVGIPAYQDLNGVQSKTNVRLLFGVSRAF